MTDQEHINEIAMHGDAMAAAITYAQRNGLRVQVIVKNESTLRNVSICVIGTRTITP